MRQYSIFTLCVRECDGFKVGEHYRIISNRGKLLLVNDNKETIECDPKCFDGYYYKSSILMK